MDLFVIQAILLRMLHGLLAYQTKHKGNTPGSIRAHLSMHMLKFHLFKFSQDKSLVAANHYSEWNQTKRKQVSHFNRRKNVYSARSHCAQSEPHRQNFAHFRNINILVK